MLYTAVPVVVLAAMGIAWVSTRPTTDPSSISSVIFEPATNRDLDVRIVKDGELQAINNIDIFCNVEGQTTVLTLVKEGATVKKGDVLITLDSSAIKQHIEDTTLDVQKAEADVTASREMLEIQKSQNSANLEAADVAVTLAQLDLEEYREGTFPQKELALQTAKKMAEITLENKKQYLQQTRDLFDKSFVTATDVKNAEQDEIKAEDALKQANTDLTVLSKYTHEKEETGNESALTQAKQKLIRTQRENAAQLNQRAADLEAKEQALALQKRRLDKYKEQLDACTIIAPTDGLVVYASSVDRYSQNPMQEGATVRERQLLLRLPDISSMKAVVRVQEAQVSKLHEGQRAVVKIVGFPKPIGATVSKISVLSDSSQRYWNPDLKEYPVDLNLDDTPANTRPGVGAQADIYVSRLTNVLTVPITSLYSSGNDTYVFVRSDPDPLPVKVAVGATNETQVQILSGLQSGQPVLILQSGQGRELLTRAGIKEASTTQPSDVVTGPKRHRSGGGAGGHNPSPVAPPAPPSAVEKKPKVGA
jgi:HlyD family secretion protein